jgi:alpha-amylase/alpha-mannosidase (GH57 family)
MENYICIHAHFYQPPRENPWLETIEYQDSAYPYHDWNQRITAECYQPNAVSRILDEKGRIDRIINNYSRISFNFGPTLLSWLEFEDPETYRLIIEGDKESRRRYAGHGSAIAQGYNHAIMPLCNERDKITQIEWGIRDFKHRFRREPESLWLPETAVDLETLDIMAQMGLKYTILAPHQAKRVRKRGERNWRNIANQNIDPSMAYEIHLPTGRRMALFFYDGPISLAVGFEKLLSDGTTFAKRLMGAFSTERKWPQIVHIATDGETYGHHHRFGDMALAFALHSIESEKLARLINYGEYLEKHPPTHLVELWENSSWSCAHGVGRWKENCGCNSGGHPDWNQKWRTPLRQSLDWLRDHLENLFDDDAMIYLKDPWAARNNYIDVLLDRSPESIERFLAVQGKRQLNAEERVRVLKLLELQRHAMLMYTSCGWFFDEISGIESVQNLQYAGRAIQLGEELFGKDSIESSFLSTLQGAASNVPEYGNGRKVYEERVKPAMVDMSKAVGHYAVSSLFQEYPEQTKIYSYLVDRESSKTIASGKSKLVVGRCRITSSITSEVSEVEYGVIHLGDHNISGGVRPYRKDGSEKKMINELTGAFEKSDLPGVFRFIDEYFGESQFSLRSLFRDEQRRALDIILKNTNADLEELNRQSFERTAPLMQFLMHLGLALPPLFKNIANAVINCQLRRAFETTELNDATIADLLETAKFWSIDLDKEGLAYTLRETIERLAQQSHAQPGNPAALKKLSDAVRMTPKLPFIINFYKIQNSYYDAFIHRYPGIKKAAEKGDQSAKTWVETFKELGAMLSIKVE